MNSDSSLFVRLYRSTRIACLGRPILTLPLELIWRNEVVLVLKRLRLIRLVEGYKQESMVPLADEPLPPVPL